MPKMMKRAFSALAAATLVLFGCKNTIDNATLTGNITGFARFLGETNNTGIVVSAESVGTSGMTLSVTQSIAARGTAARSLAGQTTTDSNGAYTLSGLAEGTYTIYASSQNSLEKAVSTGVTVAADKSVTAADLNLTPTGHVQGTAQLNGTPSLGIMVYIAGTSYSAMTDSSGGFTISSVPAATAYTLVACMQGYSSVIQQVDVAAGVTTTPPTNPMNLTSAVITPTTGTISGTAQRGGSTIGNAGIFVYLAGTSYITMTGDSGAFNIGGVAPGTYTVTAAAMGCSPTSKASVVVNAGSNTDAGILSVVPPGCMGTVITLAGLADTTGSIDGMRAGARFYCPFGIATDGSNLFVADTENHTIRKIVISTGVVSTLAGLAGSYGNTDGTGAAARFWLPRNIATDGTNLYVADNNSTIRKIVISTGAVSTLVSGIIAIGMATDGTNLYAVEGSTVRKIVISTGAVTALAPGIGFSNPCGLATDGVNLYVTDSNCIWKVVISTGAMSVLAGSMFYGTTDGTGTEAQFDSPYSVATDGTNLYVADTENHTIRKVVISTGVVTTLAGSAGSIGSADGTGASARFRHPFGIATDGTTIYVADTMNYTIRMIK